MVLYVPSVHIGIMLTLYAHTTNIGTVGILNQVDRHKIFLGSSLELWPCLVLASILKATFTYLHTILKSTVSLKYFLILYTHDKNG